MSQRRRQWKGRAPQASAGETFERALLGETESNRRTFDPRADRKTQQLCQQVRRALMLALAGECGDDVLRDVYVDSVEPMGNGSQLLIRVMMPRGSTLHPADVLARVNDRSARLRAIVARSICRKRVPGLSFVAVPQTGQVIEGRSDA